MTSHQIFEHWVRDMIKKHGEPGEGEMEAARDLFDRGRKAGLEEASAMFENEPCIEHEKNMCVAARIRDLQSVSANSQLTPGPCSVHTAVTPGCGLCALKAGQ